MPIENRPVVVRALKCEQAVLSRADGSVIYSQGGCPSQRTAFENRLFEFRIKAAKNLNG